MARYVVKLDRKACIGAAVCSAMSPERWKMVGDGKVDLLSTNTKKLQDNAVQEYEFDSEDELQKFLEDARVCPVNVIHVIKKDSNEQLI